MKIYNKAEKKNQRRALRKSMPRAEAILWNRLRNKQILGFRFLRQYGVDSFILDFYCPKLRLAIEVDGESHYLSENTEEIDIERQKQIENHGIRFLRVTNSEVYNNLEGVIEIIYNEASKIDK